VTGTDIPSLNAGRAYVADRNGVTYLEFGVPTTNSGANAGSDAGHVAGFREGPDGYSGFLLHEGSMVSLPGTPVDVNDAGQVVLRSPGAVWQGGGLSPITPLPLMSFSEAGSGEVEAWRVNDLGQVIGISRERYILNPEDGTYDLTRPFLWDAKGGTRDLNALMGFEMVEDEYRFPLEEVTGINNVGQIVGYTHGVGGFLLTPVPEPSALGTLALGVVFKRRRRSAGERKVS
jgi:hypothetical protein